MDHALPDWIRANGHAGAALELSAPLDDLEPLAEIVGSARVVGLGESSHHVQEFYLLRHRILRFMVERLGFTTIAVEAPFTEGAVLDDWLRGGPGAVEAVTSAVIAFGLGDVPEFHEFLHWLRARDAPVRYSGTDLPGSLGSPLPALDAVADYVRTHDPDASPVLARARAIVEGFHDPSPMNVLFGYPSVDQAERDALTAALAELTARLQRLADHRGAEVAHHLRGAWLLDQLHRAMAVEGIEIASTFRDLYQAESVRHLLARDPGARIALVAHNWHLRKSPAAFGTGLLFPAGYHLDRELGEDYRAIGLTSRGGRTAIATGDPAGFLFREAPLPPPEDTAIEAAFPDSAPWTLADLRAAPGTKQYPRMRMADYFTDQPAADCFDALVCVTETNGTAAARS